MFGLYVPGTKKDLRTNTIKKRFKKSTNKTECWSSPYTKGAQAQVMHILKKGYIILNRDTTIERFQNGCITFNRDTTHLFKMDT